MTTKFIITQNELDKLEDARLQLCELMDKLPPQVEFELSKVRSILWKTVNTRRIEVEE